MSDGCPIKYPPPDPVAPLEPDPELYKLLREQLVMQAELPEGKTGWLVGGYHQVRQVFSDQRFSRELASEAQQSPKGVELSAVGSMSGMDPPEHTRLRKLVASAFTVRRVEALRPGVAAIVNELIDAFSARPQPADLVTSFSELLPVGVICEMLGVPAEDLDRFHDWTGAWVSAWKRDTDEVLTGLVELYAYFEKLIAEKRAQPGEDLLSALIAARDEGDRMSEEELTMLGCSLLVAGFETAASYISMTMLTLLHHPAELSRLRAEPGLIPRAVEELLRYVHLTGGAAMARVTTEEVELGGVTIPAGETVLPVLQSANRDPSVFSDPDRFDISRELTGILTFGHGFHHCPGAQLARVELQEALRGLITRLPGLELAVPASELRFKPGLLLWNLRDMPVTWKEIQAP
jgi:cytochrome P450